MFCLILTFVQGGVLFSCVNDSYLMGFCGKGKVDCLYFDISRFIIQCRL